MKPILISAHNPMSGPRHMGHLVSTMADWPTIQDKYELYLVIDDLIASLLYPRGRDQIASKTFSVAREFFATGIKPGKSHVVLTSMLPEVHELALFTGSMLDLAWLNKLYAESFGGLLGSFQRYELGLPRLCSVTEAVYPQMALATMTVGLGAAAFQGGEEMRGYVHIIEALCDKGGRGLGFQKPQFLTSRSTFLLGTDGRHMASENAIYLSSSESELQRDIKQVKSSEVFRNWYGALGQGDLAKKVEDPLSSSSFRTMHELLVETFRPFRECQMSNTDIAAVLEESALAARERLCSTLAKIKKAFGIPGYA